MTTPEVSEREARDLKMDLQPLDGVIGVVISTSNPGVGERRSVRVTLAAGYIRVPPKVMRTLTDRDLGVADVSRQGDHLELLAV
jgi:hypothetical protein